MIFNQPIELAALRKAAYDAALAAALVARVGSEYAVDARAIRISPGQISVSIVVTVDRWTRAAGSTFTDPTPDAVAEWARDAIIDPHGERA